MVRQFCEADLFRFLHSDPSPFEFPVGYRGSSERYIVPSDFWFIDRQEAHIEPEIDEPPQSGRSPRKKVKTAVSKKPRAKKSLPKAPDDYQTVSQIAQDMGIDPKHARKALRASKIEKPPHGWSFPPSKIKSVQKAIKDNLK